MVSKMCTFRVKAVCCYNPVISPASVKNYSAKITKIVVCVLSVRNISLGPPYCGRKRNICLLALYNCTKTYSVALGTVIYTRDVVVLTLAY